METHPTRPAPLPVTFYLGAAMLAVSLAWMAYSGFRLDSLPSPILMAGVMAGALDQRRKAGAGRPWYAVQLATVVVAGALMLWDWFG